MVRGWISWPNWYFPFQHGQKGGSGPSLWQNTIQLSLEGVSILYRRNVSDGGDRRRKQCWRRLNSGSICIIPEADLVQEVICIQQISTWRVEWYANANAQYKCEATWHRMFPQYLYSHCASTLHTRPTCSDKASNYSIAEWLTVADRKRVSFRFRWKWWPEPK